MPFVHTDLLFSSDPANGATGTTAKGDQFEVNYEEPIKFPDHATQATVSLMDAVVWFSTPNVDETNNTLRVTGPTVGEPPLFFDWTITIPKGLYDVTGLAAAITRELSTAVPIPKNDPLPLITLTADAATSKIVITLNYQGVEVDFNVPNSLGNLLGFGTSLINNPTAEPLPVTAPDVARFNTINSYLLHCDLVDKGLRLNNTYSHVIGQVLIDVKPNKQIIYQPQNPPVVSAAQLIGASRTRIKAWLTNENNVHIDTNGEYFSFRLRLSYFIH